MVGPDPKLDVPALALFEPVLEPIGRVRGRHEELHLHLLELPRTEDEVAGRDLVAEGLADLRDPERRFLARELQDVLEVDEDALRRLGSQVDGRAGLLDGADRGLEHEVEVARLREVALLRFPRMLRGFAPAGELLEVIRPEALLARAAVDERVREAFEVARGLPHARVLDDRRVDRDDVVALLDHRPPPLRLDVVLQQHAVVPVVIGRADAAVDLRGGEHEAATLGQRDDLVHRHEIAAGARGLCHQGEDASWSARASGGGAAGSPPREEGTTRSHAPSIRMGRARGAEVRRGAC